MSPVRERDPHLPPVPDPPVPDPPVPDPPGAVPVADLRLMQLMVEHAARGGGAVSSERELIDQIAQLESLQHSLAALQADRIRAFARAHVAARTANGVVAPEKLERSVAGQIALACRISPTTARSRVRTARDLREGLDHVRGLFAAGELSSLKTAALVSATADLDADERRRVDEKLAEHDLPRLGLGRLRDLVRSLVARVSPQKFRARAAAARTERRVTLRPGPDGMSWLTALVPVEQGAACLAALRRAVTDLWATATATVTRTRAQTMADTLVERITGQSTAEALAVEIQAVVPVEALIDPDCDLPAEVSGLGLVPVERLLGSRAGRLTLRRLITREGVVVGGDSRRRYFTGPLADLVRARDGHRCREPYCDAPIRHVDHVRRHADGGLTDLDNGRGVCEFHNYVREQPGWTVRPHRDGISTITPTGHAYVSPTPRAA